MKHLITLAIVLFVLAGCGEPSVEESTEVETISFSYGYETRMVETHPFGEDGPVVVGCEGVYFD